MGEAPPAADPNKGGGVDGKDSPPPQPHLAIEAPSQPVIAVNHRIKLSTYYRVANSRLEEAEVCRREDNLLALYDKLMSYSSLASETIPKHPDYGASKTIEKQLSEKKLLDVADELESLKPVVQQLQLNRGGQPLVGNLDGSLEKRDESSSVPIVQPDNQIREHLHGCSTACHKSLQDNSSRKRYKRVEESTSESSTDSEEFFLWNIGQPSLPGTQVLAISNDRTYRTVYVPENLKTSFLEFAEANTEQNLETCGIIVGTNIVDQNTEYFVVTALIIPKQKSTPNTCEATNEEEILEAFQQMESSSYLGWIHTHPTQGCFMSSVDLHNHFSYQMDLPEAFVIVMAPSTCEWNVYHLTVPCGMDVIGDCSERGFHPHGRVTYEECSHVKWDSTLEFDVVDLREW